MDFSKLTVKSGVAMFSSPVSDQQMLPPSSGKDKICEPSNNTASTSKKRHRKEDELKEKDATKSGIEKRKKQKAVRDAQPKTKDASKDKEDKCASDQRKAMEKAALKERISSSIDEKRKGNKEDEVIIEQSPVVMEDHVTNMTNEAVRNVVTEEKQQSTKENKDMMDKCKNKLNEDNQKQVHSILKMAMHDSYLLRSHITESELPPLSKSEAEKFEEKWRQQKIVETEAVIQRLALMQEERQVRLEQIRSILSNGSFKAFH